MKNFQKGTIWFKNNRCKASCNGRFDGMWSKTMVGYGDESDHFVVELTYNYNIKNYKNGKYILFNILI